VIKLLDARQGNGCMLGLDTLASLLIFGVLLSLEYALVALGVTIIFGLMKLINFAHGEIFMLGGYIQYYFLLWTGLNPLVALPVSFLAGLAIGSAIERALIRPTYTTSLSKAGEYAVIITFGLSLFLQNFALFGFGYEYRSPPALWPVTITVGTLSISGDVVLTSVMAAVSIIAVLLFIERTWAGLSMKAVAQNLVGAQMAGIRPAWTNVGFALGAGLATIAGALLAHTYLVYPYDGVLPVLTAFTVVVLGGLGSIKGTLIASFIVGMAYSFLGALVSFSYVNIYGLVILLIVLVVRPQGLFGQKERTF